MCRTRDVLFLYPCEMPIIAHECLYLDMYFSHTLFNSGTQVSVSGTRYSGVFAPHDFHCYVVCVCKLTDFQDSCKQRKYCMACMEG